MDSCKLALLAEVALTPKPGLVDQNNTGSHRDMDLKTFERSTQALTPFFLDFFEKTLKTPGDLFLPVLRAPGLVAEEAMLLATGGVNTHKGLIFSLGLIACAMVKLAQNLGKRITPEELPALRAIIMTNTNNLIQELEHPRDFNHPSHGEAIYQKYRRGGIRKEAMLGYPTLFCQAYPNLKIRQKKAVDQDIPFLYALLEFIVALDDTNLLKRGGLEGEAFLKTKAKELLQANLSEVALKEALLHLDKAAMERNLSPGGAADHIALLYFLHLALAEPTKTI